jgi:hypothetical protein
MTSTLSRTNSAAISAAREEVCRRDLKDLRDVLQAARPDAIDALLVFLHLLKCDPQGVTELGLPHLKHQAAHANPLADVHIDGARANGPGHGVCEWCKNYI